MLRIPLASITQAQENAWRRLAADAAEPNVFFEADYVLAAARAFPDARVSLLVAAGEDGWDGCLPVREKRLLGMRAIDSAWKHLYSFLGTPLVRRGRTEEFAAALLDAVEDREVGPLLAIRNFAEGPVLAALRAAHDRRDDVRVVRAVREERAALRVTGTDEDVLTMSKKRRKELERLRRRLAEELGAPEISAARRDDDGASVAEFLRLEAEGWKGEAGTAMACDERHAEFFRAVCAWLGREDRLRIRSLESPDRVAAISCDFVAGDVVFGFKSAFDEKLSNYSPGIILQVDNLLAVNAAGRRRLFDSCGDPDNKTLNSFWPDRRALWSLVFARRDLRGLLAARALEARGALRDRRS
jgi:CelD/BcsL family acetyltransferase involved in cellulose biosynthesis